MRATESIFAGFIVLAIIMLLSATTAIWRIHDLGSAISGVIEQNYMSIQAARTMEQDLTQLNGLYMARLLARDAIDTSRFKQLANAFSSHLERARSHSSLPGEAEILSNMAEEFRNFVSWSGPDLEIEPPPTIEHYQIRVLPQLRTLQDATQQLLKINELALHEGQSRIKALAKRGVQWLSVLLVCGLLAVYGYYRLLSHSLMRPFANLLHHLHRLAQGEAYLRLPSHERNEFGDVAAEINRMLEQFQQTIDRHEALCADKAQIARALLELYDGPAIIFDLRREVLLTNASGRVMLLSAGWRRDLGAIVTLLREGKRIRADIELTDGKFRLTQEPMRDSRGGLLGTFVTLINIEPPKKPEKPEPAEGPSQSQRTQERGSKKIPGK